MNVKGYIRKRFPYILIVCILVVGFAIWYAYMAYTTAQTDNVEKYVKNAINNGLTTVAYTAPRTYYTYNGSSFYSPDVSMDYSDNIVEDEKVYDTVLEQMQISEMPFCKIEQVSLNYFPYNLTARVSVEFYVLPFIKKTIYVQSTYKTPEFKDSSGNTIKR